MAVQSSPVLPQTPKVAVTQFTSSSPVSTVSGSTFTTLYTGGTNGTKISSVFVSNTSTSAGIVAILTLTSTVSGATANYPLMSISMPALLVGYDTVIQSQNMFPAAYLPLPIDGDGNPYLFLTSSLNTLAVGISSAIQTTGGRVSFTVIAADF